MFASIKLQLRTQFGANLHWRARVAKVMSPNAVTVALSINQIAKQMGRGHWVGRLGRRGRLVGARRRVPWARPSGWGGARGAGVGRWGAPSTEGPIWLRNQQAFGPPSELQGVTSRKILCAGCGGPEGRCALLAAKRSPEPLSMHRLRRKTPRRASFARRRGAQRVKWQCVSPQFFFFRA